jgi:hypothetical protein
MKGGNQMKKWAKSFIVTYPCHAEIVLFNRQHEETGRAKIDLDDVAMVEKHGWSLDTAGYAAAVINGKMIRLHRYLMNFPPAPNVVDHINRDNLDNRRANLRICSIKANANNKSGYHRKMTARELDFHLLHGYTIPKNVRIIASSQARR